MWHNYDIDFARWLHPAMWHMVLEFWQWVHQVAAPRNVIRGSGGAGKNGPGKNGPGKNSPAEKTVLSLMVCAVIRVRLTSYHLWPPTTKPVLSRYFWLEVAKGGSSPICHFWVITAIMDYFTVQNLQFGQRLAHDVQMRAIRWHKVTSYHLPLELWDNMSWESISKPECGDRPALLCRIFSWIPCRMVTIRSPMASWNQPWQMPFQLQKPSLRWLDVNAKCKSDCSSARCSCRTKNLSCTLPVRQWVSEWWGHTEQVWNWWWRWWWRYVKTSFLSRGACWFLMDANLVERSCLITCISFN